MLVARTKEVGEVEALASSILDLRDAVSWRVQSTVGETTKSVGHVNDATAFLRRDEAPLIGAWEVRLQAESLAENDGESAAVGVQVVAHVGDAGQCRLSNEFQSGLAGVRLFVECSQGVCAFQSQR